MTELSFSGGVSL